MRNERKRNQRLTDIVYRRRTAAVRNGSPPNPDYTRFADISKTRNESVQDEKEGSMAEINEVNGSPPTEDHENPPSVADYGQPTLPQFLESVRDTGNLPLNDMFKELTETLKKKMPNAKNTDIAALIGIRPQSCSQYKTGSDGRKPPWNILLQMMTMLNLELIINQDGWSFRTRRKKRAKKST